MTPQSNAVELNVDRLTVGDKFTVHNPTNVEVKNEHDIPSSVLETAALPLSRLLFGYSPSCRPTFVTDDDPQCVGWIIPDLFDGDPCRPWHSAASVPWLQMFTKTHVTQVLMLIAQHNTDSPNVLLTPAACALPCTAPFIHSSVKICELFDLTWPHLVYNTAKCF